MGIPLEMRMQRLDTGIAVLSKIDPVALSHGRLMGKQGDMDECYRPWGDGKSRRFVQGWV
ncbi:hypothetical protein PSCICE_50770 [Pseudomonas cichorii]|nr:hypothetical protein PSCICE_50770 [Pseudomonas cichorii]